MDNEDNSESSQGTLVQCKIKRGIIWGNEETSALIKVWGEAEIKYALSSLKRNIEIFEVISSELSKLGYSRSASECRTKTKSLRKLYKRAVLHNSTSGSGRSKFIWYDEMANIFRTDTSIHPLQTTESESSGPSAMEAMQGGIDNAASLTLFEDTDCEFQSYGPSETSGLDTQSNDGCEPSTSGCSSSQSTPATVSEKGCNPNTVETSNYEATLDPATRLALIRKRKQRSTAAARLDNTLSGFVAWVKESDQLNRAEMKARDKEDILFQKEVINNLRVASTSLQRLTQFLTDTGSEYSIGKDKKKTKPVVQTSHSTGSSRQRDKSQTAHEAETDSEADISNTADSGSSSVEDSDDEGSVSLLSASKRSEGLKSQEPVPERSQKGKRAAKEAVKLPSKMPRSSIDNEEFGNIQCASSPYLIVKKEKAHNDSLTCLRTPPKRKRMKKKNFHPRQSS